MIRINKGDSVFKEVNSRNGILDGVEAEGFPEEGSDEEWELLKLNQLRCRLQFVACDRGFDEQSHCVCLFLPPTVIQPTFHSFILLSPT